MEEISAPFDAYRAVVRPEWIDDNRHMNMGYYLVVFDLATDEWMRFVGLDRRHRRAREVTTFCLEAHVTYHREVRAGDPLRFTTLLLGHDAKRVHYIHAMYHASEGYLAATNELMSLHVHLATRRGGPMAPEVVARLARIQSDRSLLDFDAKRIHYIHEMYHADAGYLAATNELMSLHVSEQTRRGAPMADEIVERLRRIRAVHDRLPRPPQVGRVMGLAARPTTQ